MLSIKTRNQIFAKDLTYLSQLLPQTAQLRVYLPSMLILFSESSDLKD